MGLVESFKAWASCKNINTLEQQYQNSDVGKCSMQNNYLKANNTEHKKNYTNMEIANLNVKDSNT